MTHWHDIAACGDLIAAADAGGRVSVWSGASRSPVSTFAAVYMLGGRRLALCGEVVVTAGWAPHGVYAYGARNGSPLWERRDLKEVQHLAVAGDRVAVGREMGPMEILDARSGETVARLRGLRRYAHGPAGGAATRRGEVVWLHELEVAWRRPVDGFGTLALAASADGVMVSTAGGSLSYFSRDGELRWRPPGTEGAHVTEVAATDTGWAGILYSYERDAADRLRRWSADGELLGESPLGTAATYEFGPGGDWVIDSRGCVFDLRSGETLRMLGQPVLEEDGGGP